MSPCLTGGGRAYKLDFEMIASPSTSWISSSPSSTLSETSNSPIAISTRKPRTPRKRPNQTYNEAATLLSTAYPKIFSAKQLTKPCKFTKPHGAFSFENSELLPPFPVLDASGFLLQPPVLEKPNFLLMPKIKNSDENPCQGPGENDFEGNSWNLSTEYQEDLDAESILDGEIEEGIDSIMGNSSVNDSNGQTGIWYGHQIGLGFGRNFDWGFGMSRALRNVDDGGDWWRFPAVDVLSITPKFNTEKKKKKKTVPQKRLEKASSKGDSIPKASSEELEDSPNSGLLLKLNYSEVANAWSDRGSPFPNEVLEPDSAGNDVHVGV